MISDEELRQIVEESRVAAMRISVYLPGGVCSQVALEVPLDELRLRPEVLTERYLIPALKALKL